MKKEIEVLIDHNCEKCYHNWTKKTNKETIIDDIEKICPECGNDKTIWSLWMKRTNDVCIVLV